MSPLEQVLADLDQDRITDLTPVPDVTIVLTEDLPAGSQLLIRHHPWGEVEVDHRYATPESWVPARYRGMSFVVRRRASLRLYSSAGQGPADAGVTIPAGPVGADDTPTGPQATGGVPASPLDPAFDEGGRADGVMCL